MSDIALPLFVETISQTLVDSDGSAFTLPDAKLSDTWICSLRFLETTTQDPVEKQLNVVGIRAAIGPVLAPPTAGKFKLNVVGNNTAAIDYGATAEELLTALGEGVGLSCSKPTAGCWIVRLTDDGEEAAGLEPADDSVAEYNTLVPQSFVRIRAYEDNSVWYHEIRLVQAPYAFADSAEDTLPDPPRVTRVLSGAGETGTEAAKNEIQKLYVPNNFKGTFYFTWEGYRSAVLGGEALTVETVADALNGMFDRDVAHFQVTNPEKRYAYIEFIGALEGAAQDLIEVELVTTPPAALNFRLQLDRAAASAALRVDKTAATTFEIEVRYVGANETIETEGVQVRKLTVQADVKLIRELIYDELALVPSINWLKRMGRKSYVPFSEGAVITGSQKARFTIPSPDDLGASVFSITHGMNTDEIDSLLVRENKANGRVLQPGEYAARITDENQIEITLASEPTEANSIAVIISTINNVATFQDHYHPIARITGDEEGAPTLREELVAIKARLSAIEALVTVTGGLAKTDADAADQGVDLPKRTELYPGHYTAVPDLSGKVKLRPGRLFPAIHDAAVTAFTALPLPDPAGFAGSVFYNDTGAEIQLRTRKVPVGGFFGSDGRAWLQLSRNDSTNSYFPTELERELWMLAINSSMLRPGMAFRVDGELKLRMVVATTKMQALLVIEIGQAPSQSAPTPTSLNLQDVVWDTAAPMLEQRIVIGDVEQKHDYGCAIVIGSTGAVTATKFLYGGSSTADNKPSSANFVIRARLRDFDTENSIPNAKGLIWYDSTGESAIK
ncbi:MAG: hypothetical protein WCF18_09010 [Chthoniobacteraceae bacterium]